MTRSILGARVAGALALTALTTLGALGACGGATAEGPGFTTPAGGDDTDAYDDRDGRFVDDEPDDDDDAAGDGLEVEGLGGTLDPADIQAGLAPHLGALTACYHDNVGRMRYIGGQVELKFKIARDGAVKWVQLRTSDVGAWAVERCLLGVARAIEFVAPTGGEADFTQPLEFAPGRPATWWEEERAEAEVRDKLADFDACAQEAGVGTPSDVWVTLYLAARGQVTSVGFASRADEPFPDAWAECAAGKATRWQLTDPRGRVAKLGFRYN